MKNRLLYIAIGLVVMFLIMRSCEGETKVITETKTVIKWKEKKVIETIIDSVPKLVYVEKVKTIKGKDSIIYKDKPSETTITANKYETEIKTDSATAKLQITTTGELLDVQGVITYPEKETTTTITKIKDKSGLYLYGSSPINSQLLSPEIGLQFNIRNKMFISSGVQYNNITNNVDVKIGVGIKIF